MPLSLLPRQRLSSRVTGPAKQCNTASEVEGLPHGMVDDPTEGLPHGMVASEVEGLPHGMVDDPTEDTKRASPGEDGKLTQ